MATESKGFFSGMLGKAEEALKGRNKQLKDLENDATQVSEKDVLARKLQNEKAVEGKIRLTTDDKKY